MEIVIVLGNRMEDDGSISYRMKTRLALTLQYFAEHKPDYIIVSGGLANKNAGITEAAAMERWLLANGVPQAVILKEDKSLTTAQNAKYAVPMALSYKPDKITLITSKEHFARKYLNPQKLFKRRLFWRGSDLHLDTYSNK